MIRAVLFDLDGTLADTLPLCLEAFRKTVKDLTGRCPADGDISCYFGPSDRGVLRKLLEREPELQERALPLFLHYYESLHETMAPSPFPGAEELLTALLDKGMRLGMVTGKDPESADISLKRFGLDKFFPEPETGSPHAVIKAQGIRRLLNRFELSPEEALYVGDAPSDVIACREAGIPVAAAAWADTADHQALKALAPDYFLTRFRDLYSLLGIPQ